MSPAKVPALMYALAADVLGGSPSIDIPIAINKARPSLVQQPCSPSFDSALTADLEQMMGITLRLVWAQLSSELNLGALLCSSSSQLFALQLTLHLHKPPQ
jgi:hypothetical protein